MEEYPNGILSLDRGRETQIAPALCGIGQKKGENVHAHLRDNGESLTLIDRLFDTDASGVLAEIAHVGKNITDSEQIVVTHAHLVPVLRMFSVMPRTKGGIFDV
jgi:glyoxylase-like metal-dependent hydrolase (beta-lactamase superfamily II)